jgi:hypothetical protein
LLGSVGLEPHAVLGPSPGATVALVVSGLAPVPCALKHHGTPVLVLLGVVELVNLLGWQLGGVGIGLAHQRAKAAESDHAQSSVAMPGGRPARVASASDGSNNLLRRRQSSSFCSGVVRWF